MIVLGHRLPSQPQVIFKGVTYVKDRVAINVLDPPVRPSFFHNLTGYFKCGNCQVCNLNKCKTRKICDFVSKVTHKNYTVGHFITCSSMHVVYMLQCPCGLPYVGWTTRELNVRFIEHIANIRKGYAKHNVAQHYDLVHNRDPSGTLFMENDHFIPQWRGGYKVRELSKMETKWLYIFKSYVPHGLNIDWDVNCFIDNS